jgi:hypothetical protein
LRVAIGGEAVQERVPCGLERMANPGSLWYSPLNQVVAGYLQLEVPELL